ncbi:hypothetical protein CRUP_007786 [Coryphaenoides rupestris]|nr:hypothetical protein CRUP_007786 [Coryphaenoides rupestris]
MATLRALRKLCQHSQQQVCSLHMSATRQEAVVISGRKLARQIREEARVDVENWVSSGHRRPHLSVVLVGDDPASHSYVLNKARSAAEVGISSETILKTSNTSEEELLDLIDKLNNDHLVDGLLITSTNARNHATQCLPARTWDGFHVVNVGRLCLDQSTMLPATPWGIMEIIKRTGIPNLITADMIKEGAAVIDVGINRVLDPLTGKSRLVYGQKGWFITPVPGGVGPMTVAMLMKNTIKRQEHSAYPPERSALAAAS